MIRNNVEYREAMKRLEEDERFIDAQRSALEAEGLTPEEVEYGLNPMHSFHAQLKEEIEWYERVQNREIEPIRSLTQIGRLLIAARIAVGMSQKELAGRLEVSEAQVSKDERNEYYMVSTEKAQRVLDALGVSPVTKLDFKEDPHQSRDLVPA